MTQDTIETISGNKYIYATKKSSFLFVPPPFANKDKRTSDSYYQRKLLFWEKKGVFEKEEANLDIYYDSNHIESNLANLRQLLIEVTDECNLACKYCAYGELYGNYDKREGKKQTFENVKALIDYLAQLWKSPKNISFDNEINVGFYGGEPLINFSLIKQVIDYLESLQIKNLQFIYNMTTNAVLLSRHMDYLVEKRFQLLVSLDGGKENNSYRVTNQGKESFDKIITNLQLLKDTYPEYFNKYVEFNSVLHNRTSVASSYQYIKNKFNKFPSVTELNDNGIVEEKKKEFAEMFTEKSQSLRESLNCEEVREDLLNADPEVMLLSNFFEAFTENTYRSLPDLFFRKESITYLPTSTCPPFYKRIFLTVNGKIFPCEKIGQTLPLGSVQDGNVYLDSEYIKDLYADLYEGIMKQCKKCYLWKNCGTCIFFFKSNQEGKKVCNRFFGKKEITNYYADALSRLETSPELHEKIINEIIID